MMKHIYKSDWFWVVALPTALIAVVFLVALLLAALA
jgi:hypothetical protein